MKKIVREETSYIYNTFSLDLSKENIQKLQERFDKKFSISENYNDCPKFTEENIIELYNVKYKGANPTIYWIFQDGHKVDSNFVKAAYYEIEQLLLEHESDSCLGDVMDTYEYVESYDDDEWED